ncbi:MAG: hypothetical protein RR091_12550 [Cloacibacillus sp.]
MCWNMALAVASTAIGYSAEQQQAQQQNAMYQQNALSANQSASEKYAQEYTALVQEREKAADEKMNLNRNTIEARGKATASSLNEGLSNSMVQTDLQRQGSSQKAIVTSNIKAKEAQTGAEIEGITAEAQNRINSVQQASEPSLVASIISGIGPTFIAEKTKTTKRKDTGG